MSRPVRRPREIRRDAEALLTGLIEAYERPFQLPPVSQRRVNQTILGLVADLASALEDLPPIVDCSGGR